jgi:hypothetical protein
MWCDENLECLNLQDFIGKSKIVFFHSLAALTKPRFVILFAAIIQSLVPKNQVDHFRIMKTLPGTINRIGLKLTEELNGENLFRIYEHIFQV